MPHYAAVFVVHADSPKAADRILEALADDVDVAFLGSVWPVAALDDQTGDPEFGTLEAFDQHPER